MNLWESVVLIHDDQVTTSSFLISIKNISDSSKAVHAGMHGHIINEEAIDENL